MPPEFHAVPASGERGWRGRFFRMDDGRLLPVPSARIPTIRAARSAKGARFAAGYGDCNPCASFGVGVPRRVAPPIARLPGGMAAIPGLRGVVLASDDVLAGMKRPGTRTRPLMRSRAHLMADA